MKILGLFSHEDVFVFNDFNPITGVSKDSHYIMLTAALTLYDRG